MSWFRANSKLNAANSGSETQPRETSSSRSPSVLQRVSDVARGRQKSGLPDEAAGLAAISRNSHTTRGGPIVPKPPPLRHQSYANDEGHGFAPSRQSSCISSGTFYDAHEFAGYNSSYQPPNPYYNPTGGEIPGSAVEHAYNDKFSHDLRVTNDVNTAIASPWQQAYPPFAVQSPSFPPFPEQEPAIQAYNASMNAQPTRAPSHEQQPVLAPNTHIQRSHAPSASAVPPPETSIQAPPPVPRKPSLSSTNSAHRSPPRGRESQTASAAASGSRQRAPSSVASLASSLKGNVAYAKFCENCEVSDRSVAYCNLCQSSFCAPCWDKQFAHKKKKVGPGGVPHEKTVPAVAEKVRNALEPPADDSTRERLCKEDEITSWFGIERPSDQSTPIFQDYGRFTELMASTDPKKLAPTGFVLTGQQALRRDTRTPSLVSFVGQTGAGKSTLIKLMIDLAAETTSYFPTPVIGARGAHVPTSEDVHLYLDPQTYDGQAPILFADCEGLEGGEREPVGALFKKKRKTESQSSGRFQKAVNIISERELTWAHSLKAGREFAVTNLYPRLLFTFSDVIVFVLKNPRVVEDVFAKLVNWAAAAIETSSNQPVLPHAIIVLNASENDIDPALWDVGTNTSMILDDLAKTVNQNETFKKYAQTWRLRGKTIDTLEQLLLSYYSSVQILRVPEEGRPKLMQDQVDKLYRGIMTASIAARSYKSMLRMLLDVEDLQSYLNSAFIHFSGTLDYPFDFVQASFINSPIPPDFGGNILKLAINIMDVWQNQADGLLIFQAMSYMVASCIMIDSTRNNKPGAADQVFPQYLEHIDAALENFCKQHWPCEFVMPGTSTRCVNVLSGHGKGHQLKDGRIFAVGEYESQFTYAAQIQEFRDNVFNHLYHLLDDLQTRVFQGEDTCLTASLIHRERVLHTFYQQVSNGASVANEFDGHAVCLCCLFEIPEHPLPCGHVLCTPCIKLYGTRHGPNEIEIYNCPLESSTVRPFQSWTIRLKPKSAGVRVLSLDGGGMRGIVELEILRAIEEAMGIRLPVQCFFDLIVGTSTGGLITLGLGAMNWSVEKCLTQFEAMVKKAFTPRIGAGIPGIGFMVENFNHSRYETKPLEQCLQEAFTEDRSLFGGSREDSIGGSAIKIAVTSTSLNGRTAIVFGNYNRVCTDKLSYQFLRPEKNNAELKIWQAARATSAAPRFFRPFEHEATKTSRRSYIDGALFHNNPIEIAERERKLIWPELEDSYPDVVLSLGTATSPSLQRQESVHIAQRGVVAHGFALLRLSKNHLATSIECERIWEKYLDNLPRAVKQSRFVRLNPELHGDVPTLDDVKAMPKLQQDVRNRLMYDTKVKRVAVQLFATSFYFQLAGPIDAEGDEFVAKGRILSRLQQPREVLEIGRFFKKRFMENSRVMFVVKEQEQPARKEHILEISKHVMDRMFRDGVFEISTVIRISHRHAVHEVLLCVNSDFVFPISGFPRSIFDDERTSNTTRERIESNPNRWAGNSFRSKAARQAWTRPSIDRLRKEVPMPDFTRPRKAKKLVAVVNQNNDNNNRRVVSDTPSTRGPAAYFRGAFRALYRPNISKPAESALEVDTMSNAATVGDIDVYQVDQRDSETYHSYLGSLSTRRMRESSTSYTAGDEGAWVYSSEIPGIFEMGDTSVTRPLFEMEGSAGSQGAVSDAEVLERIGTELRKGS